MYHPGTVYLLEQECEDL